MSIAQCIYLLENKEAEINNLPKSFFRNWEAMLRAIKINSEFFSFADYRLQNNEDFILKSLSISEGLFSYVNSAFKNEKNFVLKVLAINRPTSTNDYYILPHVSELFRADKDIVKAAVIRNGLELQFCAKELRGNKELVFAAVAQNPNALKFSAPGLKSNRELVIKAVSKIQYPNNSLSFADSALQADKEVVMAAVNNNGMALAFAEPQLQNNVEIVRKAFRNNGNSLQFAAAELRADPEFCKDLLEDHACNSVGRAFQYFHEAIRFDSKFLALAIKKSESGEPLLYTKDDLRICKEVVNTVMDFVPDYLKYLPEKYKDDYNTVSDAILTDPDNLAYASESLKDNEELVFEAIENDAQDLSYISERLRGNKKLMKKALQTCRLAYEYATEELKKDLSFTRYAVKKGNVRLSEVPENLRGDKQIVLAAAKNDVEDFAHASESLKRNTAVVRAILKQNLAALQYVSDTLKADPKFTLPILQEHPHLPSFAIENTGRLLPMSLLFYLPESITGNKEQAMVFTEQYAPSIEFMGAKIKGDKELVLHAFNAAPDDIREKMLREYYRYIDPDLYEDSVFLRQLGIQTRLPGVAIAEAPIEISEQQTIFTFSNGSSIRYSTEGSEHIIIAAVYQFASYKGETIKDALDVIGLKNIHKNIISLDKLDKVCYDFGDNGFKKELRMEMGKRSGPMVAAIANLWYQGCGGGEDWLENGVVVNEDWTYFDCITIDPEYAAENKEEFTEVKKYISDLIAQYPPFARHLKPVLDDMEELSGSYFYLVKYCFN